VPPRLYHCTLGGGFPLTGQVSVALLPTETVRLCSITRAVGGAAHHTETPIFNYTQCSHANKQTDANSKKLRKVVRDHPGRPVPEKTTLDFYGAAEDNGGRGTDSPGGCHPNRTNGTPTHTTPPRFFYRPDALPAAQPTASKH